MDDAEDGCVGANSQGEHGDDESGKKDVFPHHPKGIAAILEYVEPPYFTVDSAGAIE